MIFSLPACSDDEPVEPAATAVAPEKPGLPERQWYPRPKYSLHPQPPGQQFSQQQMMQSPAFNSPQPAQQPQTWQGGGYQYQQPGTAVQQQQWYGQGQAGMGWQGASPYYYQAPAQQAVPSQQGVTPYYYQAPAQQAGTPQQGGIPYYYYPQAPQRPWGEVPQGRPSKQHPPTGRRQSGLAPQEPWQEPWSDGQVPDGMGYPGWGTTPYEGYPWTVTPGYIW